MTIKQELQPILDKIVRNFRPEKVILFGSYAWGKPSKNSDVDLLVIKDDAKKTTREMAIDLEKILFERDLSLDLLVYKPEQLKNRLASGDSFVTKIMNQGQILYGN